MGSTISRIYGLPKIHKIKSKDDKLKLRPIISSIGTYNYKLAKYLTTKLSPFIPKEHCVKDTFTFINNINQLKCSNKYLISYDVVSLYTNIPLKESIELAVDTIITNEPDIKIGKAELSELFEYATAMTHFLFEGNIYDQIDGVAMGSPLAPVFCKSFHGSPWKDLVK